jgi:CRISPR system Cascade subunit CasA
MPATPFNLIRENWLPMRRADGSRTWMAPWGIVADLSGNPVVAIDWPRPDFNGATLEFLIGLLATAFAPKDLDEWLDRWETPPSPEELRAAFERAAFAFDLDGDGPRFMQDQEDLSRIEPSDIGQLLIDQPGEQTLRLNKDLFVKRGNVDFLSRQDAAMALYVLQTYAPSGGQGHRTSMRGGGPLTTLVVADPRRGVTNLWHQIWPNVSTRDWPDWNVRPASVFPWIGPTRTSESAELTTPEHGHPLQAYWGMPRRVRLLFEEVNEQPHALPHERDSFVAVRFQMKNYGTMYRGWVHPLSPYVKRNPDELPLSIKGNPGGISYRHWLGLVQEDSEKGRLPARCVSVFRDDRAENVDISGIRLVAFGYDMDNAKARCWYQAEMPVPNVAPARRETFDGRAGQLVKAADAAAGLTRSAVKRALFARPADAKGDLSFLADRFWHDTEARFFGLLNEFAKGEADDTALRESWLQDLRGAALAIFDNAAPSQGLEGGAWKRLVEARRWLTWNLNDNDIRTKVGLASTAGPKKSGRTTKGKAP